MKVLARPTRTMIGLLLVVFTVLLWPVVLTGRFLLTGDAACEFFPLRTVAFREILQGRAPVWVDGMASGYPLFAMGQNAIAYPFTCLYMLDPLWGEQVYVLLPFLLAPIFTWMLGRRLGLSPLAAAFAAFSFTCGGFFSSSMAHSGVMQNSAMWLPLMLLAVDAARDHRVVPCLLGGAVATALSLLGGHTQTFVFAVMMTVEYGLFLSVVERRWPPLLVSIGATLAAGGLCAFQIMETLTVIPLSVRAELPHYLFVSGSLSWAEIQTAFLAPLAVGADVTPHLCALALALAAGAVLGARRRSDVRIWFWVLVAAAGVLIMLGAHGPVYEWFSYLPVLRSLRQSAARHAVSFTFALAMLAGYGWDQLEARLVGRGGSVARCVVLLALAILALGPWSMSTAYLPALTGYLTWKAAVTLLLLAALACAMRLAPSRARGALLGLVIVVAVVPEAAFTFERFFFDHAWTRDPRQPTELTRWLQAQCGRDSRIYTIMSPFYRGDVVDPANRSAMFLRDVAGYEPLYLARYSNALSEVNRVEQPFPDLHFEVDPLEARSYVLDLLNMRYVVEWVARSPALMDRWVTGEGVQGRMLIVLSTMFNAARVRQAENVALVSVVAADGTRFLTRMQAGFQTAEWAYDRPDVKPIARHMRARVARTGPEGGHVYEGYIPLPDLSSHGGVVAVEVRSRLKEWAQLAVDGVMVMSDTQVTRLDRDVRWRPVTDAPWSKQAADDKILVYENLRRLPRAWFVSEVEKTTEEHALARIRGFGRPFDPRRTALLETDALPAVGGVGEVRLASETPAALAYDVSCSSPGVLVTSEIWYPGWEAAVDGVSTPVLCADYMLRAVAVPPGRHRLEMRYTAPGLRRGLWVSAATLLLVLGLWLVERRRRGAA